MSNLSNLTVDFWKQAYQDLLNQNAISKSVIKNLQLCVKVGEEILKIHSKIYERTNRAQAEELIVWKMIAGN